MANTRTDLNIQNDIENELVWDSRVLSDKVDVDVIDGVVTLEGKVESFNARRAAEQDAWSILGVIGVVNDIKVSYATAEIPTDEAIEERIKNRFLWDADLKAYKLDAVVENGMATITGTVNTLWKKNWAETLTESTFGVTFVKNSIAVVPSEDITDEVAADEISESLSRKLLSIELEKVDIEVDKGIAKFSGEVTDYETWRTVLDTARFTSGVKKIEDELKIEMK
jgi:osmotically-inducible protein OsmY